MRELSLLHLMGILVEDSKLPESFSTFTALHEQICSTLWLLLILFFCKFVCGMGGTSCFWLNENLEKKKNHPPIIIIITTESYTLGCEVHRSHT